MRRFSRVTVAAVIGLLPLCLLRGQSPTPLPPAATPPGVSQNSGAVLRVHVNLVLVPVVVRDASGHAVGNLRAEDFTLLDNNKPQQIVSFSIEKPAAQPSALGASNTAASAQPRAFVAPRSFTAIHFDDVHLETENMNRV